MSASLSCGNISFGISYAAASTTIQTFLYPGEVYSIESPKSIEDEQVTLLAAVVVSGLGSFIFPFAALVLVSLTLGR